MKKVDGVDLVERVAEKIWVQVDFLVEVNVIKGLVEVVQDNIQIVREAIVIVVV